MSIEKLYLCLIFHVIIIYFGTQNMETSLWREITHLWFFGWPATGVPEEASAVIAFIIEARAFMKNNPGPNVVHCRLANILNK
jgi:protein tyrosine phosphatase